MIEVVLDCLPYIHPMLTAKTFAVRVAETFHLKKTLNFPTANSYLRAFATTTAISNRHFNKHALVHSKTSRFAHLYARIILAGEKKGTADWIVEQHANRKESFDTHKPQSCLTSLFGTLVLGLTARALVAGKKDSRSCG